jgi:hypothetical protein
MSKNKYLLLFSSVGVLALLATAAVQENFLREWRQIQARGRAEEGPIPVQLRQIVNPSLKTSDRCVSCHVTMAPGESWLRTSPWFTIPRSGAVRFAMPGRVKPLTAQMPMAMFTSGLTR